MSVHFQGKQFNITIIVYAPTTDAKEAEIYQFYEDLQDLLELTWKKDVLFIIGHWNAKVGSQEIPGIIGKFGLGVQNEAGQRLTEFCQENTVVIPNSPSNNTRDDSTRRHHQMVNTKSDWLYSLQPKMEKLYTVSKNRTWSWLWLRSSVPYRKNQI